MNDYLQLNRANWDERAPIHAESSSYSVERFHAEPDFISPVVAFDAPRLGDISGLRGIHLQCHIGTDTLSLSRLGAQMTGLDFSGASLEQARKLADGTGTSIRYIESDVYEAGKALGGETFDFVYTGIGAIGWLPSIEKWADAVAAVLRPGGRLFIRECHPMLWTIDDSRTDALTIVYPYFETDEPLVTDDDSTYVETDKTITAGVTHEWNHGLGEIFTALINRGFQITQFVEHTSVPWDALPDLMSHDTELNEWRLTERSELLPLSFTLQAVKNG